MYYFITMTSDVISRARQIDFTIFSQKKTKNYLNYNISGSTYWMKFINISDVFILV